MRVFGVSLFPRIPCGRGDGLDQGTTLSGSMGIERRFLVFPSWDLEEILLEAVCGPTSNWNDHWTHLVRTCGEDAVSRNDGYFFSKRKFFENASKARQSIYLMGGIFLLYFPVGLLVSGYAHPKRYSKEDNGELEILNFLLPDSCGFFYFFPLSRKYVSLSFNTVNGLDSHRIYGEN